MKINWHSWEPTPISIILKNKICVIFLFLISEKDSVREDLYFIQYRPKASLNSANFTECQLKNQKLAKHSQVS